MLSVETARGLRALGVTLEMLTMESFQLQKKAELEYEQQCQQFYSQQPSSDRYYCHNHSVRRNNLKVDTEGTL